jgi:hypothetical protein
MRTPERRSEFRQLSTGRPASGAGLRRRRWPAARNADSLARKDLEASRRVTLKGHLHPPRGRSDVVSAREKQEGIPEEAEHNT